MPLQLTSAIQVGDLDVENYTHVQISSFLFDRRKSCITLEVVEGYLDEDDNFVEGKHSRPSKFLIKDLPQEGTEGEDRYSPADPQYSTMVGGTNGESGELVYNTVANALYQWLIDNGHYAGTIV